MSRIETYSISFFSLFLLIWFINGSASGNKGHGHGGFSTDRYYPSAQKEGYIGIFDDKPFDYPADNVFTVEIETLPAVGDEVWLTYELYGISNFTGISRSVNDQSAVGGYYATCTDSWNAQREQLQIGWIRKGRNIIRFTLPGQAAYNYRVRNLGIHIRKVGKAGRSIIINQPVSKEYPDGHGYINGFINGPDGEQAEVFADGNRIENFSSEFELFVAKKSPEEQWKIKIKVLYPDGEVIEKQVTFNKSVQADYFNEIARKYLGRSIKRYLPEESFELKAEGAYLALEPNALSGPRDLSITPLRAIDIPALDQGMVNVTGYHNAYRFLPHGTHFDKDAIIALQYDPEKLPDGYTPQDIRTYYFDETTRHWVALQRKGIDYKSSSILSNTSHFTDMINGVITVPESPQTSGFIPTSMADMDFANPAMGVNTIEPPIVGNMGTANLEYPIVVPAGRQGMQPELSIRYSSDGDNDWLGLGWSLQIPSVTIETRWGVPRYLDDKESETYLLNGEQLWPLAHRGELVSRSSEKQFYSRIEGTFHKIIRHGDGPSNYWWEVWDKSGVRYSYGGTAASGIIDNSVLRGTDGNISNWGLVEIRDPDENFIQYEYSTVQDTGIKEGTVPGFNTYVDNITYTGHGNETGHYKVVFIRDRQLNEEPRKDITINAQYGFKKVIADLLRKIEVSFNGEAVRSYQLDYTEGAFFKTLLATITEYDALGAVFTHHEFEYYNDVISNEVFEPYTTEISWENAADNIAGNDENTELINKISMLGSGRSVGAGAGMSVTVGPFDGNLITKDQSAGSRFGINVYQNDGLLAFVDIDGDGRDDKVFKGENNSGLFFRPNTSDNEGGISFGDPISISGISDFNLGWSTSGSIGLEATFGLHIAAENSLTTDVTNTYFADVNGDKLIDIVKRGTVYFNTIVDGVPTFSTMSSLTPSPIHTSGNIDPDIVAPPTQEEIDATIDQYPLHDVVKVWEAPFGGSIHIDAPVALLEPAENSITESEDGVRVAIQHKGTELWSETIQPDDFSEVNPTGVSSILVDPGDRIYFRVQSIENGSNDRVLWKPVITYSDHRPDLTDANGLPIFQFNAYDDFLISTQASTGMPIDGTVNIEGRFSKPVTTDDIRLEIVNGSYGTKEISTIQVTKSPVAAGNCKIGLNGIEYNISTVRGTLSEVAGKLNEEINKLTGYYATVSGNTVTVTSYSPRDEIDATFKPFFAVGMVAEVRTPVQGENGDTQIIHQQEFSWEDAHNDLDISVNSVSVDKMDKLFFRLKSDSQIGWTAITWNPRLYYTASEDPDIEVVTDEEGNPLLEFFPIIDHSIYNKSINPTGTWSATAAGTAMISLDFPNTIIINSEDIEADSAKKDIIFTIKKGKELVYKATRSVTFGRWVPGGLEAYLVEFADDFSTVELAVEENDQLFFDLHLKNTKVALAIMSAEVDISISDDAESIHTGVHTIRAGEAVFGSMYRAWGQFAYNGNRERANQPIDEDELKFDASWTTVNEVNLEDTDSPDEISAGYDAAGGHDQSKTIFIYMFPVAEDQLYTGYDDLTYVRKDIISSSRMGRDDIEPITPLAEGSTNGTIQESGAKAIRKINVSNNSSIQAGIQPIVPNLGYGTSNQLYDYMDMNGDAFPDIVSPIRIQYTLPTGDLDSKSTLQASLLETSVHGTFGLNGGGELIRSNRFTTNNTGSGARSKKDNDGHGNRAGKTAVKAAASGNLALNGSVNMDAVGFAFMDINNDGLPDKVFATGMVALNLGYAFSEEEHWGFAGINSGATLNLGSGLAINISYGSIEAGIGISKSWNSPIFDLLDINGDGLLDKVFDVDAIILKDRNGEAIGPDALESLDLEQFKDLSIFKDFELPGVREFINNIVVRINTGNGFSEPIVWNGANRIRSEETVGSSVNGAFTYCIPIFVPPSPVPVAEVCFNPDADASIAFSKTAFQISDIDGDEYPDLLQSDEENRLVVKQSAIGRTNLLKAVSRPLGASFTLDYKRAGNTYGLPMNIWTLSQLEIFDGYEGDGVDVSLTRFEYEEGVYNRDEREFYGFRIVRTHEYDPRNEAAPYRSTVQAFKNDTYFEKGLVSRMVVQDADQNIFNETLNTYELRDIRTGETLSGFNANNSAAFPALIETKEQFYEGQGSPQKSTRLSFDYDPVGNVISYTDFGDLGSEDDVTTTVAYHNAASSYIRNVPSAMEVSAGGQSFRKRASEIDERTGNITQIRNLLENGNEAVYDVEYDDFGNLVKIIHPENANGNRFFYEYQYDAEVQTYITTTTDAYGYGSSYEYDFRFGKIVLNTDLNGQQIRYEIDAQGRTSSVTGPYELARSLPYTMAFDYNIAADVPWARTRQFDPEHPDNDMETIIFVDGLKRKIEIKKDRAVFTGSARQDEEKMIVSGVTNYDAFGREIENFYPVSEPKGNETVKSPDRDAVTPTKSSYDILDRLTKRVDPDGTVSTTDYGFGNDRDGNLQFSIKVTDGNGIVKESFKNTRELTTSLKEQYSSGSDLWTSYHYNAINRLEEVLDDQENPIKMKYDWLGRLTETVHPDAGTTRYDFDLASNLIGKTTANLLESGKSIKYEYEFDRLIKIVYPENPHNNVTYMYGEDGATDNGAGRIVFQEDATGAQEFYYDPLGAITKIIRTVIVPGKEELTYITRWTYDTWGRITEMIYPDNEILHYNYDLGGNLNRFKGVKDGTEYNYLSRLGYNKFGQIVFKAYGNGSETFYNYFTDDFALLESMQTSAAGNRMIMDNAYTYDDADNILRIQNKAENPKSNLMSGSSDYYYVYDDLYRLTKAGGSYLSGKQENSYELDMEYNSIHNIISKKQAHTFKNVNKKEWNQRIGTSYQYNYEYQEKQPHAPENIGERSYTFDANGNLTGYTENKSGQEGQVLWDEENRIKAIANNGAINSYAYDADNHRVLKSNGGGQTVSINGAVKAGRGSIGNFTIYLNPYTVIRNKMVTKHFYINNERIATKLTESNDGLLQTTAGKGKNNTINYPQKSSQLKGSFAKNYSDLGIEIEEFEDTNSEEDNIPGQNTNNVVPGNTNANVNGPTNGNGLNREAFVYYYHPDHLGSSSFITDNNGEVTQHLEYFAFGETFIEEHSNTERTPYLYNAKELDDETELYYYGSRYYDPVNSHWLSVDPLNLKTPSWSPYVYGFNNPVVYTDPDGKMPAKNTKKRPRSAGEGVIGNELTNADIDKNRTTTVFGRFVDLVNGGGIEATMKKFKFKTGENQGGFNILNISNWTLVRNKAWIWDAAARGDKIRFISDPKNPKNIYRNGISGELTVTGEEVKLLESLGYRWNPNTKEYNRD